MAFDKSINADLIGVHRVRRGGAVHKYFRKGPFRRKLPDVSEFSDEFVSAYTKAKADSERFLPSGRLTMTEREQVALFGKILGSARERSSRKGVAFSLSLNDIERMYQAQKGRCALTGIPFSDEVSSRCNKRPFSPSLDRIKTDDGYTSDNVRLVCQIANNARHSYSDDEFYRMCRGGAKSAQTVNPFCKLSVNHR